MHAGICYEEETKVTQVPGELLLHCAQAVVFLNYGLAQQFF